MFKIFTPRPASAEVTMRATIAVGRIMSETQLKRIIKSLQLLTDGWWEKLLPNQKADAPCDVNPNPTRNTPIVITDSFLNVDYPYETILHISNDYTQFSTSVSAW